ncbi:hypothetical protein [Marinimicrobium sp. C2-29]|uniref:hypothetical protein n=1 Tax=Marinimicrobium sp. C2-29 TaxID=3139825 RepID=UPI003139C109
MTYGPGKPGKDGIPAIDDPSYLAVSEALGRRKRPAALAGTAWVYWALALLNFIRSAQWLGFSLDEHGAVDEMDKD